MIHATHLAWKSTRPSDWLPVKLADTDAIRKVEAGEYTQVKNVKNVKTSRSSIEGVTLFFYTVKGESVAFLHAADEKDFRPEVEKLKADWAKDACWDIEDTQGFEAWREELKEYSKTMQASWDSDYNRRIEAVTTDALWRMRRHFVAGDKQAAALDAAILQAQALERIATALERIASREEYKATEQIRFYRDLYQVPNGHTG